MQVPTIGMTSLVGSTLATSRSKYLVLQLYLSLINISGDISKIKEKFNSYLYMKLSMFLDKYRPWLGKSADLILDKDSSTSLMRILVCI